MTGLTLDEREQLLTHLAEDYGVDLDPDEQTIVRSWFSMPPEFFPAAWRDFALAVQRRIALETHAIGPFEIDERLPPNGRAYEAAHDLCEQYEREAVLPLLHGWTASVACRECLRTRPHAHQIRMAHRNGLCVPCTLTHRTVTA